MGGGGKAGRRMGFEGTGGNWLRKQWQPVSADKCQGKGGAAVAEKAGQTKQ